MVREWNCSTARVSGHQLVWGSQANNFCTGQREIYGQLKIINYAGTRERCRLLMPRFNLLRPLRDGMSSSSILTLSDVVSSFLRPAENRVNVSALAISLMVTTKDST